ncbi:MAG: hypothetical protein KDD64_11865 [Bdellovibrionales bacterium]|nr:hypothetical protein [Bdellovibrionales bacterium]
MSKHYKRVNVLIRPDQYDRVVEMDLSLSGLVRDLLDDRMSDTKIVLSVSKKTKEFYDMVVSNFGADDLEIEEYIAEALDNFLLDKKKEIEKLRDTLSAQVKGVRGKSR